MVSDRDMPGHRVRRGTGHRISCRNDRVSCRTCSVSPSFQLTEKASWSVLRGCLWIHVSFRINASRSSFSSSLGVSGLLILVASIVLGNMFGILGMLLSIPAAAILSFIYNEYLLPRQEKYQTEKRQTQT